MEPVDVTFKINSDDIERDSRRVVDAITGINTAGEQAVKAVRAQISEQKSVIKQIESDIKEISKNASKMSPGRAQEEMTSALNYAKRALLEEKGALKDLEKELDATVAASKRLTTVKQGLKEEMARLKLAGQGESAEFQELARQASEVESAIQAVNKQTTLLAKSDGFFEGLIGGMAGVAGVLSAGAGAMALFGGESEDLEKTQTRLQSLMAVTVGLQETYNVLQEQSAFWTKIVVGAKKLWTSAQTALNTQLGIGVGLSKALMVSGVGLLIAGIAALVIWYQKWSEEQEEINKLQEEFKQIELDTVRSMAKQKVEVNALIRLAEDHTKSLESRNAAIKKLNELMPAYEGHLDAEGRLIANTEEALKSYLLALYKVEKAKKVIAKMEAGQEEYDTFKEKGPEELGWLDYVGAFAIAAAQGKSIKEVTDVMIKEREAAFESGKKKIEDQNEKYKKEFNELAADKTVFEALFGSDKTSTKSGGGGGSKAGGSSSSTGEREAQRARDRIAQMAVDSENRVAALTVAAMEEGAKKRRAQIELEYDREIDTIDKKLKEVEALSVAARKDGSFTDADQRNADKVTVDLGEARIAAAKTRDAKILEEEERSRKAIKGVWDDVYSDLQSDLGRELAGIEQSYEDRRKVILDNVADTNEQEAQLSALSASRARATSIAKAKEGLKEVDTKREIELEKQKLANKTLFFETDKAAALLKIERDSAEESLALYKQMQEKGVKGLEDEIELLTAQIATMNDELAKMPVDKLREGLGIFQGITGALAGLDGEAGELFSSISSSVDTMKTAFDSAATAEEKLSAAASSIVQVINTITDANSKRKEKEKEFYENALAFAHEYALALNEQLRLQSEAAGGGFVTDYQGKINAGFDAMTDASKKYNESLAKLGEGKAKIDLSNAIDWNATAKTALAGAAAGAAIGSVIPGIGTVVGGLVGGAAGFVAGLFGTKKKKEETGGLLDVFPALVDGSGKLNKELAQTLINTNQVDDSTKQLLQDSLDWADAVEEANEQIKSVVSDLAGDLGNSLRTAIVDAWKAGENASEKMFDAAAESLQSFVEQLLYSVVFSDVFTEFRDRMAASLTPGGDGSVVDDYSWLLDEMDRRDEVYTSQLAAVKADAARRGIDMWKVDDVVVVEPEPEAKTQERQKGSFETLSQDTGDLLLGQFTAIRIHTSNIYDLIAGMESEHKLFMSSLSAIEKNTFDAVSELKTVNVHLKRAEVEGLKIK